MFLKQIAIAASLNPKFFIIFFLRYPIYFDQRQNICKVASKSNKWDDLSFILKS